MKNNLELKASHFLLGAFILSFLTFWFARYIQAASFDLVQHFLLVDELTKHAGVRAETLERIGPMAVYPPVAHWMATIIGWIGGSELVGITIVTIVSVYLCYVLIICLVGASSPVRALLLALAFLLLMPTHSLIGWEVVGNFFYPQIVADVVYFGTLLWVSKNRENWQQTIAFLLVGQVAMWIQPLVATHLLAAGCALTAFQLWNRWNEKAFPRMRHAANLVALVVGSAVIVFTNPAFKVMRSISAIDGHLVFGYSWVLLVALICGAVGAWNLRRYWRGKAEYVDAILGSAVVVAVGLVVLQFALLKLHGDGSPYAIKKHMFIVLTLGMMNAIRVIASYLSVSKKNLNPGLVAPVLAGLASVFVLKGYTTPAAPIVNALAYANHAFEYQLADFTPGNTVFYDSALPLQANVMISLAAFQHSFDARAIAWQGGASITEGAEYAMIRRTPHIEKICDERYLEREVYVVVNPSCVNQYFPGETLSFAPGGGGWQYASNGWSLAEEWGAWSLGNVGGSVLLTVPPNAYQLVINGMAYVSQQHPTQTIVVEVNGAEIATWTFDLTAPTGTRAAEIPKDLIQNGSLRITLKAPGAVSPAQIGQSADTRVLGLGVQTLTLRAVP
ncbi:hypothetical protein KRX52_12555 [Pseudomonas sp. MAP12]|uniref:DUF7024 domain-containing protein n=1 Tax=Geopseudomonas aromaticivorans TaxID=2849492 RepID=A0ABS6MZ05_9GAMM|nr:hypothetical protein [Pseudomonas aromaticivorans]MBV2133624.1 hypothetical protein [Pseudomonas aromaticivorans]